ncbi:transposable element Tcb2 transposase [Trichonephila clavipes]|nr:transposable element Tcb2 transposase [Trichonephila clavipes]
MARRNHLDDFTRGRMIGKLEEGRTVTSVAAEFGKCSKPQVQLLERLVVAARERQLQGGPIYPPAGEKRSTAVSKRHCSATGRQVSWFTVARCLHKGRLFARRPERCLPLKVDHRRHRLQWCREHKNWTTVNGVVSSLRMRVGSVPEAILNEF